MLDIKKNIEGEKAIFMICGRIDSVSAPQFEQELKSTPDSITELVVDMSELDYISSAGLRVLLANQKRMNTQGKMTVKNVNDVVMEIFEVTGFSDILTIE